MPPTELPLDGTAYYNELMKRVSVSKGKAPVADPLAPVLETFHIKDLKKVEEFFGIVEQGT